MLMTLSVGLVYTGLCLFDMILYCNPLCDVLVLYIVLFPYIMYMAYTVVVVVPVFFKGIYLLLLASQKVSGSLLDTLLKSLFLSLKILL